MAFQVIVGLIAWLTLGCVIAWMVGEASDLGGQPKKSARPKHVDQSGAWS